VPPLTAPGYGDTFRFICLTDEPALASAADRAGVDLIGLDIERIGKIERQGHLPHMRISRHTLEQLPLVGGALARAGLFLRCNPVHPGSSEEVEQAIAAAAEYLMLPYFHSESEVETFVALVDGRARVLLLLETPAAVARVREIVAVPGIDDLVVGLNDLSNGLGFAHPLQLLASPVMERLAATVCDAGLRFGIGGLADPLNRHLPVAPSLVFAQYPRLGATSAFLARRFTARGLCAEDLHDGVARCRAELDRWSGCSAAQLEAARVELERATRHAVAGEWPVPASG
jgi:hypothetical protein